MKQPDITAAAARAIERVRELQDSEGYWLGECRSLELLVAYGAALVATGHDQHSERLKDVCNDVVTFARDDFGFSDAADAPSLPGPTFDALLLLRRCRSHAAIVARAEGFLHLVGEPPTTPVSLMQQWVLAPESHASILSFRPPVGALRRFAGRQIAPRVLASTRGPGTLDRKQPGWLARKALGAVAMWQLWPVAEDLDKTTRKVVPPSAIPSYVALAALQLRAGDNAPLGRGREAMVRAVTPYVERFLYDDRSVYHLLAATPVLEFLRALGRDDDAAALVASIERVGYRKGGWLRHTMLGANVLETALTVQVLLDNGVSPDDPAVEHACDFLHAARTHAGIWPRSWEASAGRPAQRDADCNVSGAVLLALHQAGSAHATARHDEVTAALVARANDACALQALAALGMAKDDQRLQQACAGLLAAQRPDGSWFDPWIAGAPYGTTMALDALIALGARQPGDPDVERALHLFTRTQNADGGWGFDTHGERTKTSTVEHTAMALYVLSTFSRPRARPMTAMENGVHFLLASQLADGTWPAACVCNDAGWAGYASTHLANVFALRAIAAYRRTLEQHLPTVPQLVRSRRIAENKAARTAATEDDGKEASHVRKQTP